MGRGFICWEPGCLRIPCKNSDYCRAHHIINERRKEQQLAWTYSLYDEIERAFGQMVVHYCAESRCYNEVIRGTNFCINHQPKEKQMQNKFYVAAQNIINHPGLSDLNTAVENAKDKFNETGRDQYVVKIVKKISARPNPILVEDID